MTRFWHSLAHACREIGESIENSVPNQFPEETHTKRVEVCVMSDNTIVEKQVKRTCRICKQQFVHNDDRACTYHPESFSGETAQRWLPPGTKGGNVVHNFYSCCGGGIDSLGCCWTRHRTFDEPEDVSMRKPGMGIEP